MKKILLITLLTVVPRPLAAQLDVLLRQIERNNTTLQALADGAVAEKLGNHTGTLLPDPGMELARLWGNPATIGNRVDFAVSQDFDLAVVSGMRSRQAALRNELIDLGLASERTSILLEAKQYGIELIHCNRLAQELALRLQHAQALADGYARKLEGGDANRLEYNKARLNLSAVQGEIARNEVERAALHVGLQRLNGGIGIVLNDTDFPPVVLPADFDSWYAGAEQKSPVLEYARREVEADRRQVSLARVEGLPEFSVGYMREGTLGQRYEGVTVGISVPLWASRNRVRQARAAYMASEARAEDTRVQFYEKLRNLYVRAAGLGTVAAESRRALAESTNTELLRKALDAGEISLLDYIVEMGLYYDTATRVLETERDFQLAYAALTAVEL